MELVATSIRRGPSPSPVPGAAAPPAVVRRGGSGTPAEEEGTLARPGSGPGAGASTAARHSTAPPSAAHAAAQLNTAANSIRRGLRARGACGRAIAAATRRASTGARAGHVVWHRRAMRAPRGSTAPARGVPPAPPPTHQPALVTASPAEAALPRPKRVDAARRSDSARHLRFFFTLLGSPYSHSGV